MSANERACMHITLRAVAHQDEQQTEFVVATPNCFYFEQNLEWWFTLEGFTSGQHHYLYLRSYTEPKAVGHGNLLANKEQPKAFSQVCYTVTTSLAQNI